MVLLHAIFYQALSFNDKTLRKARTFAAFIPTATRTASDLASSELHLILSDIPDYNYSPPEPFEDNTVIYLKHLMFDKN